MDRRLLPAGLPAFRLAAPPLCYGAAPAAQALGEVERRFAKGVPQLDPEEDMKIEVRLNARQLEQRRASRGAGLLSSGMDRVSSSAFAVATGPTAPKGTELFQGLTRRLLACAQDDRVRKLQRRVEGLEGLLQKHALANSPTIAARLEQLRQKKVRLGRTKKWPWKGEAGHGPRHRHLHRRSLVVASGSLYPRAMLSSCHAILVPAHDFLLHTHTHAGPA